MTPNNNAMKYLILFYCLIGFVTLGYTQHKTPVSFRDYLVPASHLDSLKDVERKNKINPQSSQYLHLLIAIELGKLQRDDSITTQQYNKIVQLATKHKSTLGLAMANYIMGSYNSSWQEEVAYEHIMKAQKQFAQQKDTSGIIQCLGWSLRQFMQDDPSYSYGPLGRENLLKMNRGNYAKLMALAEKSKYAIDRFTYYRTILNSPPAFSQETPEKQREEAFKAANEILDKNPHLVFLRKAIYRAHQQGYFFLKKTDKVLEYGLKTLNHPDIKANYQDYRNVAGPYIKLKKYDSAIVYLEEAIRRIKIENPMNIRSLRLMNERLKNAYFETGNWKAGIKAYDEYNKYNNLIHQSDRRLAVYEIREKYSVSEKEAELKQISLEKQVVESKNKLLDAEKREAALKNLALENQATESKSKLLQTQIEIHKKESAIEIAESQKKGLFIGLVTALGLIGIILVFSTKLRKTNTKLLELQAGRDKFYTIIAHDLRSPISDLNDVGGLLHDLIKEGQMQEVDKVIQQIENMRHETQLLINNLFEWGKSQYFSLEVEEVPQQMDVVPLVQTLCQTYLPFAEVKKVTFLTKLPSSQWLSIAPKGFMLAVRNLLDNALKNTPSGGSISVNIAPLPNNDNLQTQKIALRITDTGKGIASDQLRYMQEVFAGKTKPDVGLHGLGLGMVLISHFVKKNKAHLTVESQVGKGTCFTLVWEL